MHVHISVKSRHALVLSMHGSSLFLGQPIIMAEDDQAKISAVEGRKVVLILVQLKNNSIQPFINR